MRHLLSAAAIAALLSSGCAAPTELLTTEAEEGGTPLPVTRLRAEPYSFAYNSGIADSVRLAIRDADQWQHRAVRAANGDPRQTAGC